MIKMVEYKHIVVSEDTKNKLSGLMSKSDTWDDFLSGLADGVLDLRVMGDTSVRASKVLEMLGDD